MKVICYMTKLFLLCVVVSSAFAQYPSRPINVIVFTPPGGPSDTAARAVMQHVSKSVGQQILVDNRPGADGAIAVKAVMNASADGHMLLWGSSSMVGLPMVQKASPVKSLLELAPVSAAVAFAFGMYVHPGVPARTVAELVDYAKANPGKLRYATGPLSEFLATSLLIRETGVDMVRVTYKGAAQVMPDLLAGHVQMYITPMSIGQGSAKAGKLRMLATLLPERSPIMPDVPTMAEAGFPSVAFPSWNGILAPANTPRAAIDRLSREVQTAVKDPEVAAALIQRGVRPLGTTPEELAAMIAKDEDVWRRFVRDNKIEAK